MTPALLELRDSREYPSPWWSWVVIDEDRDEVVGYFVSRHEAEEQLTRFLDEENLG